MKYKIKYKDFESSATLCELPCIIESYKTIDKINFFKSNDVCQMLYVHNPGGEEIPENLVKKHKEV